MKLSDAKRIVLKEYPSAYYDAERHEIALYSEGIHLGEGLERSAWLEAAQFVIRQAGKREHG